MNILTENWNYIIEQLNPDKIIYYLNKKPKVQNDHKNKFKLINFKLNESDDRRV